MSNIYLWLKLPGFGIISTPLNFQEENYKYGAEGLETKVLVIKASIQISWLILWNITYLM